MKKNQQQPESDSIRFEGVLFLIFSIGLMSCVDLRMKLYCYSKCIWLKNKTPSEVNSWWFAEIWRWHFTVPKVSFVPLLNEFDWAPSFFAKRKKKSFAIWFQLFLWYQISKLSDNILQSSFPFSCHHFLPCIPSSLVAKYLVGEPLIDHPGAKLMNKPRVVCQNAVDDLSENC